MYNNYGAHGVTAYQEANRHSSSFRRSPRVVLLVAFVVYLFDWLLAFNFESLVLIVPSLTMLWELKDLPRKTLTILIGLFPLDI